ncbi:putative ran guanine nucleotide release factor [Gracilariopsis chorda]|uniref:Putative ran guanine nucleotide release factor n=1 Tax=Gracilariopsis chorda TaxID=448386 RepID=A0A2V3J0N5_9FLOR|nr:putative ran guanine nucleotide release factor [Gracilariopsis chorda]|eukprot:PXF47944.1 putative ran guanine nucleotide release factor [Gracilariopsis chorda]
MVGAASHSAQPHHRPLFGGAISTAIPPQFADVSKIRQVPDNQEIFAHAPTDRSLIVELLQLHPDIPQPPHTTPASHHFSVIATDAHALRADLAASKLLPTSQLPALLTVDPRLHLSFAHGTHVVSKFRDHTAAANTVNVYVVCIRLPNVATDVLLVFNDPIQLHPHSSSTNLGSSVADPHQTDPTIRSSVLQQALNTFQINDWSLFR